MNTRIRMRLSLFFVAVTILAGAAVSWPPVRVAADPAPVIRITPPAPVFDEAKRLEELAARRKHVANAIGPNAILVMFSAEPRVYTNDVDFPFRQENNLFYLTNLNQKRATVVLMPGNAATPEILFLPRRSAAAETWTGHMYSPQEAAQLSGIKEIWEANEFGGFIKALRAHEAYQPKPESILMSARTSNGANNGLDSVFSAAAKNEAAVYLLMNFPP